MASRNLALFLRALDNPYQALQKAEFYARAHLRGFSVTEYDAKNDARTQLQQLRECIQSPSGSRPKALFVNPVSESLLADVARDAVRSGISWVSLNRTPDYVTDLRREYATLPVFCVDPDQRQVGHLQGQQFQTLLPSGGELYYKEGNDSVIRRRDGFISALIVASADRTRVITVARWKSMEAIKAIHGDPMVMEYVKRTAAVAKATPAVFSIVAEYRP